MARQQNKLGAEELEDAASLDDASAALDEIVSGVSERGAVGFSELYRYVVDPDYRPDEALADALANDPHVRADFDALVRNSAIAAIPKAAAAADDAEIDVVEPVAALACHAQTGFGRGTGGVELPFGQLYACAH